MSEVEKKSFGLCGILSRSLGVVLLAVVGVLAQEIAFAYYSRLVQNTRSAHGSGEMIDSVSSDVSILLVSYRNWHGRAQSSAVPLKDIFGLAFEWLRCYP